MATFYVLPSRHQLGQRFGEFLQALFPSATYTTWDWPELADALARLVEAHADAYVVHREDLDESLSVRDALLRQFGAALDDAIIEVEFGPGLNQFLHHRWATEGLLKGA